MSSASEVEKGVREAVWRALRGKSGPPTPLDRGYLGSFDNETRLGAASSARAAKVGARAGTIASGVWRTWRSAVGRVGASSPEDAERLNALIAALGELARMAEARERG